MRSGTTLVCLGEAVECVYPRAWAGEFVPDMEPKVWRRGECVRLRELASGVLGRSSQRSGLGFGGEFLGALESLDARLGYKAEVVIPQDFLVGVVETVTDSCRNALLKDFGKLPLELFLKQGLVEAVSSCTPNARF